ncbi:MAG: hypothetical protein ACTHK4_14210 [Mycobacteriales bacterium]
MRRLAAVLATAVVALCMPAGSAAAAAHVVTVPDPSSNTEPSQSFVSICDGMSTSQADNQACDSVAIPDFNRARAAEGLGPLVLPDDFDTLSVPEQILAITDLERVARGLTPAPGLSSALDGLAQQGADASQDPEFPNPFDGTEAMSNWAGTNSALLGAFLWMCDDGLGSNNLDCTPADQSGCWGHRHTMLNTYDTPIAMGAAVSTISSNGSHGSVTEELVGGDSTDAVDQSPTWAQIAGTLTYGVTPQNVTLTADPGTSVTATVTATSGGDPDDLIMGFESGAPTWRVSPSGCHLPAGGSCQFTVTFAPPSAGRFPGVLTVSDGTTVKTVALSGTGIAAQVAIAVSRTQVVRSHSLTVHGLVTADPTHSALPGRKVTLQRKRAGVPWASIGAAITGGRGTVTYRLHPSQTARYRLEVIGSGGVVQAKSAAVKVRVTR